MDLSLSQRNQPLPSKLRQTPTMAWSVIDLLEPLLLVVAGAAIFQVERFAPQQQLFVLGLLLIPYLLRWLFYGAPAASTLADLPLALLFLVLTPVTVWVSPYFWTLTWPELLRMLWGGAVCLGVINWALPQAGRVLTSVQSVHSGRLAPRLALLTAAYLLLGLALAALGLFNMALVNKIPLVNTLAATLLQVDLSQVPLDESFNPNRVAALLILIAPVPLAWLLAWHPTAAHATSAQGTTRPATLPHQPTRVDLPPTPNPVERFFDDLLRLLGTLAAKAGWLSLWLLLTGGLILTQSRTALLAVVVATLVILLLTAHQPDGGLRLLGGLFLGLLLVGMSYFVLQIEFGALVRRSLQTFDTTRDNLVNTQSLTGRVQIWERAVNGIADHPLTGYGLGAFAEIAQQAYPLPGFIPGEINHAHNLFLQTALDLGVPGLITFATIVGLAGLALVRCYRLAPPQSPQATWAIAMLGTFAGFLTYNLLDGLTLGARPAVAMWFFLGLAIAAGQRQTLVETLYPPTQERILSTPAAGSIHKIG